MNIDGWTCVNISDLEHNSATVRNILVGHGSKNDTCLSSFSNYVTMSRDPYFISFHIYISVTI